MSRRVYIGLGSNLDEPKRQLAMAVTALKQLPQSEFQRLSSIYLTKPMGPADQSDYYNAVAEITTRLTPQDLLAELQSIESSQGRKRDGRRWHERTLDLDMLLYGDELIDTDNLVVPHPGMHERAFVLFPLQELEDNIDIPGKGNINKLIQKNLAGEVLQTLDFDL